MKEPFVLVADRRLPVPGTGGSELRLLVADVSALIADAEARRLWAARLSPQRRARASRFTHARGQGLSIGVSLLLGRLLEEHGRNEQDMAYAEGPHGKPRFADGGDQGAVRLAFSLSHSGHLAAAAMLPLDVGRRSIGLGVDIQCIGQLRPELVRRVFSADDRARLAACTTDAGRRRLFTQLWCRAEAYAKATGQGLQWPFPTPAAGAHFADIDVGPGYCLSLCTLSETTPES